jgi:thiosulfate/3-mercaptopyruvate sulfurtransferase
MSMDTFGRDRNGTAGFVNTGSLVEGDWLLERLNDPGVTIVDTRYIVEQDERGRFIEVPGAESYRQAHIPGAVFLSLDDLREPGQPEHILGPDAFAEVMAAHGIGSTDEVVVYDTEGGCWSARLWWALRLYGHENVRLLNGGFGRWVEMGHPVEAGDRIVAPADFTAREVPGLLATLDDVLAAREDEGTVIVDALTRPFHTGEARLYAYLPAGHIPGAVNIPAPTNLDPETELLLPPTTLAERWNDVVGDAERIITYCGGGMYGAFDLFVLHLLGYEAALYDGAWEEWAANDALPIATTPPGGADERLRPWPVPRGGDGA